MKRTFFYFILLTTLNCFSQQIKTVEADYIFYAPSNISVEEAKRTALKRAKLQAIADAFGTIIFQNNSSYITTKNGESDSYFVSIGESDVKGEWIETIGDPAFGDIFYQDNLLVVPVYVKGKAREIITHGIDFKAKPLRNGEEEKFESYEFKNGDSLYMLFRSPVSGYLAIYLVDEISQQVFCAIPYRNSDGMPKKIESDKEYILFSQKYSDTQERKFVDEYEMTCNQEKEFNDFYILFSEEPFSKMVMSEDFDYKLPKTANLKDFQQWLTKIRIKNPKLTLEKIPIIINK